MQAVFSYLVWRSYALDAPTERLGTITWAGLLAAWRDIRKLQIITLLAGMLLCGTGPVRADFTVAEFQANRKPSETSSYLQGLMDGIEITNALAQTGRPVFCNKASFPSVDSFREFLARYIRESTPRDEASIASVATSALMAEYPCTGP